VQLIVADLLLDSCSCEGDLVHLIAIFYLLFFCVLLLCDSYSYAVTCCTSTLCDQLAVIIELCLSERQRSNQGIFKGVFSGGNWLKEHF